MAQQSLEAELLLGLFSTPDQDGRGQQATEAWREPHSWQSVLGEFEAAHDEPAPLPGTEPAARRKSSSGHRHIVHFIHQILAPDGGRERDVTGYSADFEPPACRPAPAEGFKPDFDPPEAPESETGRNESAWSVFQPVEAAIPSGAGTEQERPRQVEAPAGGPAPRRQVRGEADIEQNNEGAPELEAAEPDAPAVAPEAPQPAQVPERGETARPDAPVVMQKEARRPLEAVQPHAGRQSQDPVEPRPGADEAKFAWMPEAAGDTERAAPVMAVRLRAMPQPAQPFSKECAPAAKPEPVSKGFTAAEQDRGDHPVPDSAAADWSDPASSDSSAGGPRPTTRSSGHKAAQQQCGEAEPMRPRPEKARDVVSANAASAEAPAQGGRLFAAEEARPPEIVPILSHDPIEISKPAAGNSGVGELRVKLEVPESEPVLVRFVDRGGEVHVLVRSEDPGASTRLAVGLEDLQQKLEAHETQVEAWVAGNDGGEGAEAVVETILETAGPSERHAAASAGQSAAKRNPDGQQHPRRTWPDWLELLTERSDEAALRRFQKGTRSWRQ
ncbi:MAG: hypothetical protein HXY18_12210 [Bryobacteraceae bacterium]|nr:hypothetical protein [Bryobacteraceae bacterium]